MDKKTNEIPRSLEMFQLDLTKRVNLKNIRTVQQQQKIKRSWMFALFAMVIYAALKRTHL